MDAVNPRDIAELREGYQALRLAVELLLSYDTANDREIPETLDIVTRAAERTERAIDRMLADC